MRPGMRMALNAYRQNRMEGNRMDDNRMREYPPYGNESSDYRMNDESMRRMNYNGAPENRRRRDSRGRFMEHDSMATMHKDDWQNEEPRKEEHREHKMPQEKSSNVIGFKGMVEKQKKGGKLNVERARMWVESMGEEIPFEKAKAIMQRVGASECDPVEFWAVINALVSDYGDVFERFNIESHELYGTLAKAWLEDKDAVENKANEYYECIVKK